MCISKWIWKKGLREKIFFAYFFNPLIKCRMLQRIFWLFPCSKNQLWLRFMTLWYSICFIIRIKILRNSQIHQPLTKIEERLKFNAQSPSLQKHLQCKNQKKIQPMYITSLCKHYFLPFVLTKSCFYWHIYILIAT